MIQRITSPADASLKTLCGRLSELAPKTALEVTWPAEQLRLCGEAGVFEWFLPVELGGQGWSDESITQGYLALAEACLTTTFVLTQRVGACRRIGASQNDSLKQQLIPKLLTPETFATVGISHLTTSRRHLSRPMLAAEPTDEGYRLNGMVPWVTGAEKADTIVVGASVLAGEDAGKDPSEGEANAGEPNGDEILIALPTNLSGVETPEPFAMVGLTASRTGPVKLNNVLVPSTQLVDGPIEEVVKKGSAGRPGGPQTSTLAVGAAAASIAILADEASRRPDLVSAHDALAEEHEQMIESLLSAARGTPNCDPNDLRQRANSHVLRASQAALTATKGAGYLAGAAAGRHCQESLFFLVWSCPQTVQNANLCELAGLDS